MLEKLKKLEYISLKEPEEIFLILSISKDFWATNPCNYYSKNALKPNSKTMIILFKP